MKVYRSKLVKIPGRSYIDVERKARQLHNKYARTTKRNPYIKSVYFGRDKIFINLYWTHLNQKSRVDRKRRLKFYAAAIDLLQYTRFDPLERPNPNAKQETVYRFAGMTANNELFYVHVKRDDRTGNKHFISAFPPNKKKPRWV